MSPRRFAAGCPQRVQHTACYLNNLQGVAVACWLGRGGGRAGVGDANAFCKAAACIACCCCWCWWCCCCCCCGDGDACGVGLLKSKLSRRIGASPDNCMAGKRCKDMLAILIQAHCRCCYAVVTTCCNVLLGWSTCLARQPGTTMQVRFDMH